MWIEIHSWNKMTKVIAGYLRNKVTLIFAKLSAARTWRRPRCVGSQAATALDQSPSSSYWSGKDGKARCSQAVLVTTSFLEVDFFWHEDQQGQGHDVICLVLGWSSISLFLQIAEQQALGKPGRGGNGKVAFCIIQVHGRMVQRPTTDQHKKCQFGRRTNQR